MGEVEALADATTGALIARSVEPAAGEAADGHTHERNCLNCGCALVGDYCHCCGQQAHVHRTLGAFFHDLLHGVFHFEGKIWRTLPLLAWRPGQLTRRYIEGQRARFVSPMALFLFTVFLMFAAFSSIGTVTKGIKVDGKDLASAQQDAERNLRTLTAERARIAAANKPLQDIDARIANSRDDLQLIKNMREGGVSSAMFAKDSNIQTKVPWVANAYRKAKENPELLIYKLKSNSYKWSWAVIPLSIPFLWLLFPFSRRFQLYDHVVFVTYSLCFMTLLVVIGTLFTAAGVNGVVPFLALIPPIHMYRQLKGAYQLSTFGAAWRALCLTVAAMIVLSLFVLAMVTLGMLD